MVDAFYFDGKTAIRHDVRLGIGNGYLHIKGAGLAHRVMMREVDFGEPLLNAPRRIELPDGGCCEVADAAGLAHMLADADINEPRVVRVQKSWRWTLASFVFVLGGSASAYLWGLPEITRLVAQRVPQSAVQHISHDALEQLDRRYFSPSQLSTGRQRQIHEQVAAFLDGPETPPWRLHFRASRTLGSNAFALPSGDVILLDQLVAQLDDAEINAVLAHELGHIIHRHALRLLLQKAAMSIVLAAWFGDVSSAAVGISSVVLQSGYSREAESEADAYAAMRLLRCCQSAEPLISSLGKLEHPRPKTGAWVKTHPDTRQRIAAIRALKP